MCRSAPEHFPSLVPSPPVPFHPSSSLIFLCCSLHTSLKSRTPILRVPNLHHLDFDFFVEQNGEQKVEGEQPPAQQQAEGENKEQQQQEQQDPQAAKIDELQKKVKDLEEQ